MPTKHYKRRSVSLTSHRYLQLQRLAEIRGLSMSAWIESEIADAAAEEGVVVLPEQVAQHDAERLRIREERRASVESEGASA